jgi:hypothetical protein
MEEEEMLERERQVLDFIKRYWRFIFIPLFFILFVGLAISFGICNYPDDPKGEMFDRCLNRLYLLSGWFYSWSALITFVAVVIAAILAYQQLRLVRTELRASAYSQVYTRTDSAISLLLHDKVELDRYRLNAKEVKELTDVDFDFTDRTRLVTNMLFTLFENIYYQHKKFDVFGEEDWRTWKVSMKQVFAIPYVKECWERKHKGSYTSEFVEEMEGIMDERNV